MPMINQADITDVRMGPIEAGALLAGDNLIWNRVEEWRKTTPGTLAMDIPEWASFMSIFISGGGASGGYRNSELPAQKGGGGGGGQIRLLTIDLTENPGRSASVNVGAGGRPITSTSMYGNSGGATRFNGWNAQSTWTANGGGPRTGEGEFDGTEDGWNWLPEREALYLNRAPGSRYRPQTAGRSHIMSPSSGEMGGGGGKVLNNLGGRASGAGGDGFAIIHFFGIDPVGG